MAMSTSTARAHVPGTIPSWTFADKVRKARDVTGMGQVAFAKEVGLSQSTLAAYETGRTRPRFGDVEALAKRLQMRTGIPYQWFLFEDEPTPMGPRPVEPENGPVTDR